MVQRNFALQAPNDPLFDPARNAVIAPDPQANGDQLSTDDWMGQRARQIADVLNPSMSADGLDEGQDTVGGGTGSDTLAGGAGSDDLRQSPYPSRSPAAGPISDLQGATAAGHLLDGIGRSVGAALEKVRYRIIGQSAEAPNSDNAVANWAESRVGKDGYNRGETAADARGRITNVLKTVGLQGVGDPKCNQFVWDALQAGGAPAGRMPDGRIPVARDWGDPGARIAGYSPIGGPPRPGDVISNGEHVGIFAPLKDGSPGTVSAASPGTDDGGVMGGVVHNGWGFRGDEGNIVVWRPNSAMTR